MCGHMKILPNSGHVIPGGSFSKMVESGTDCTERGCLDPSPGSLLRGLPTSLCVSCPELRAVTAPSRLTPSDPLPLSRLEALGVLCRGNLRAKLHCAFLRWTWSHIPSSWNITEGKFMRMTNSEAKQTKSGAEKGLSQGQGEQMLVPPKPWTPGSIFKGQLRERCGWLFQTFWYWNTVLLQLTR